MSGPSTPHQCHREELVGYEVLGGVAVLTLMAPSGGPEGYALMQELDRWILEARLDRDVRVLVVTGAGFDDSPRTQQASHDITAPDITEAVGLHAEETRRRLQNTSKPVVAAVDGDIGGEGLELALACHHRVGRLGSGSALPRRRHSDRLTRVVGAERARELSARAEALSIADAHEAGLLDAVLAASDSTEFLRAAVGWARTVATRPVGPTISPKTESMRGHP